MEITKEKAKNLLQKYGHKVYENNNELNVKGITDINVPNPYKFEEKGIYLYIYSNKVNLTIDLLNAKVKVKVI